MNTNTNTNMNTTERIRLVKAMEFIARQVNDEDVFAAWLYNGVADGDIPYGDLTDNTEDLDLTYYISDEELPEIMGVFLRLMCRAKKSGGLCCDRIVST